MNKADRSIIEIAKLFLKLGLTAFGGPAAHIGMMEDEVVTKRKWMTHEHFLDLVGATNLIPGPNSTEMTIHIGYDRAGFSGLLISGFCFISPAILITLVFAFIYRTYGTLPKVATFLQGINPAVIAIIFTASIRLGKKAVKNNIDLMIIGLIVFIVSLFNVDEIAVLFTGGILGGLWLFFKNKLQKSISFFIPLIITGEAAGAAAGISLLKLGLTFLKIGAVLYGSGYVLIALLQNELVNGTHWITQKQLIDAIAVGQFTPGPLLSTTAFIGYQLYGLKGGLIAAAATFLPSFIFVAIVNPIIPKLRRSNIMSKFLDAVNVSSVALIAAVAVKFSISTFNNWIAVLIAVVSIFVLLKWKANTALVIIGGGLTGFIFSFL